MTEIKAKLDSIVATENSNNGILVLPTAFFLLGFLAVYYQTVWSMVSIWIRSETFAHGFLIIPIVLWMVWTRKAQLITVQSEPEFRALWLVCGFGLLWLVASLVDVLVVQQFALVLMAITGLWALLGTRLCKLIAFPMAYLLFLVPVGEGLVPVLMEFTAAFTVAMVKLSGVPVYKEGLFFYLPTGSWSVVEACSGVRYLIASAALGCLYAYLTYISLWRRLVFIVISIVVPVFANGLRAYIIVMLGHWSDMKIATGVDHLIYGWLFFGLVMFILFAIGNLWREDNAIIGGVDNSIPEQSLETSSSPVSNRLKVALLILFISAIWPVAAYIMENRQATISSSQISLPEEIEGWQQIAVQEGWQPASGGAHQEAHIQYKKDDKVVSVVLQLFLDQKQGNELVSGNKLLIPETEKSWHILSRSYTEIEFSGVHLPVKQIMLKDQKNNGVLVWSWYRVGSWHKANDYLTKLTEAFNKLTFKRQDSARIFLAAPLDSGFQGELDAKQALGEFIQVALDDIGKSLDASVGIHQ